MQREEGRYCNNPTAAAPFTDPRLQGRFLFWQNNDRYLDGPTLWTSAFSMHDDVGAWIQQPSLSITHSGGEAATEVIVMDGQGAYEGLTIVAEVSLSNSRWDWHGYIVDGELPPAPTVELPQ